MAQRFQRNRTYSLIVGDGEEAVKITNLQVEFEVTKTSNNKEKKNQASVSIYNLSKDRQKLLEQDYVTVEFRAGYLDSMEGEEDLPLLFSGQVVDMDTRKDGNRLTKRSGTDLITSLKIDELWSQLNGRTLSTTVPEGKKIKDAIEEVVKDIPEISQRVFMGDVAEQEVLDGMPLSGSPRQCLDQICGGSGLKWQIDNGILYVADRDKAFTEASDDVPKIGQLSGLIDRPEYKSEDAKKVKRKEEFMGKENSGKSKDKKPTYQCKILMNPSLVAGSVVYLEWEEISGYYQVDEVVHKGSYRSTEWYSELILSAY